MDETEEDFTVRELYYLIVKFLENGPCAASVTALRREIEENKLVIPRKDWLGNEHARSLLDFEQLNNHIPNHYLTGIAHEFNALTDRASSSNVKSVKSLLTCSKLSILRDAKSKTYDKFCYASSHVSSQNGAPYIIPSIINKVPINSVLIGRNNHGARGVANIRNHCGIYSKFCLHKQILGHLASVYCVLFDQTGNIVITGADDNLLKMWSARDGRLISTFRGHAAQITDISINYENTFIASGSLDKTVRVWSLKDTQPVAVLQGHTGMVTSLRFCPNADKTVRYLVSTGGDGHICFWSWSPNTREFNLTPTRYNEKTRPGAQMLCSSFSPGGTFLVTGSSDNYIRVYQVYPDGPEKIVELPNHADHVDSILYSTLGDSFLSGSRDGTAIIWSFRKGEWQAKCLDNSKRLSDDPKLNAEPETNDKLKVTMICWSCNDYYITTASTDYSIRVWNASQATLMHAMRGHTDELFLLEAHPTDPRILLSGGHDGNIIIWDIAKNVKIKSFFNRLEGQGHGAIFDAKFSPRGDQFVATDSHGHLMIYGFGSDTRYQAVPYEQFFHTDYHPIIRDANNYVLDEQTQMAPHLMPPPFLVDVDGNPHTANYQMLIPGRTSSNLPRIRIEERPQIEGLPPLIAEMQAAEGSNFVFSILVF